MKLGYYEWKSIIEGYILYCKEESLNYYGDPKFLEDEGTINVIGIRNNDENSFNDLLRNNDDLYIIINRPNDRWIQLHYKCTVDPSTNKLLIAHLCEGAYESYDVRPHRWIPGRTALCQDRGEVRVARTDLKRMVKFYEWGRFGINVHDDGGLWNSSLGCTIFSKAHLPEIKQVLLDARRVHDKKKIKFSYFLINHKTFNKIKNELSIK